MLYTLILLLTLPTYLLVRTREHGFMVYKVRWILSIIKRVLSQKDVANIVSTCLASVLVDFCLMLARVIDGNGKLVVNVKQHVATFFLQNCLHCR